MIIKIPDGHRQNIVSFMKFYGINYEELEEKVVENGDNLQASGKQSLSEAKRGRGKYTY